MRTALDIVRRVPGFTLDKGNTDVRGFAGAAGNVVINGVRPSSKAESLETTLARRRKVSRFNDGDTDLSGSWALDRAPDKAIRLNARWEPSTFKAEQNNRVFPDSSPRRGAFSRSHWAGARLKF